jgi:hypothetical protein
MIVKQPEDKAFEFKRAIVGGCALACLFFAGLAYVASPDLNNVLLAMAIRVGIVLFVSWLAMPQLRTVLEKLPAILPGMLLLMIVLLAARPNVFKIVGSLIVVTTALMAISNWIKKVTRK